MIGSVHEFLCESEAHFGCAHGVPDGRHPSAPWVAQAGPYGTLALGTVGLK